MLTIYTLSNCDRCRAATKWLRQQGFPFEEIAIRDKPPSRAELRAALEQNGRVLRALFNTSGRDYREQKLGEKIDGLSEAEALALLAGNGNLVKRPFLVSDGVATAGFDAERWSALLAKR